MILECEVKIGSQWQTIGIAEAVESFRGHDMRCPVCAGRVFAFPEYNTGTKAHFEHAEAHKGCPLTPYNFHSPQSKHPAALE